MREESFDGRRPVSAGYACLYAPPSPGISVSEGPDGRRAAGALVAIAQEFSPRYERHRDDLVSIDISGLERLMRPRGAEPSDSHDRRATRSEVGLQARAVWQTVGEELRREAADRGVRVHVALASTRTAALVMACARPGLTIVDPGNESSALAPLPIGMLVQAVSGISKDSQTPPRMRAMAVKQGTLESALLTIEHWGLRSLGELAALPGDELVARLGQQGLLWQAIARGEDVRPLVPTQTEERFESSFDLEWPVDTLEPLAFVLTRLLEPLAIRLERRDRGAAALQVALRLTTREIHLRRLQLPSPMRDVRTLRGLALLDLESHPPPAAIDRVTVTIDPTPGRVLQHTLFARPMPTPEQLSTLLARLAALMGQDRIGTAASVDSYQPGAFEMKPFATEHRPSAEGESLRSSPRDIEARPASGSAAARATSTSGGWRAPRELDKTDDRRPGAFLVSALRRCRQPVPVRVTVGAENTPTYVAANRRGCVGGAVVGCAGPWRTSGCWWVAPSRGRESTLEPEGHRSAASERVRRSSGHIDERRLEGPAGERESRLACWNRDEWDVALSDGAVYRIFRDCSTDTWFIDAIVD